MPMEATFLRSGEERVMEEGGGKGFEVEVEGEKRGS